MTDFWTHNNFGFLEAERQPNRIVAFYPSETNCPTCGWDEFTHAALKSDCLTCEGRGKIITWQQYFLNARVSWSGLMQFSFFHPTPGVENGDVVLTIAERDRDVILRVMGHEDAYLQVDGKTVRPTTEHILDIPRIGKEYQIVCSDFTPTRA